MDIEAARVEPEKRALIELVGESSQRCADNEVEPPKMSFKNPPRNRYRVITVVAWTFSLGYTDAAPGALLPFIEEYYNINYLMVSLIWVANAIGFLLVACFAHKLEPVLGKQKILLLGTFLSMVEFALVSAGSHFAVMVVGFVLGGVGCAMCIAQINVFMATMDRGTIYLSINHAGYGLGATLSPLLGTYLVNDAKIPWHFVYLINLGLMVVNFFAVWFSFQGVATDLQPFENPGQKTAEQEVRNDRLMMKDTVKSHIMWLLAVFIMFYQGAEVSIAGWCVSYLIDYENANIHNIGYVALAFWSSLTVSRILLTHPAIKYIGARRSLTIMCFLTIVVVVLAWALPGVIASSTFIALSGVWVGPLYSTVIGMSVKHGMLPRKIQVTGMTVISAFGSIGGAFFPFLIGVLSQAAGTYVVFPVFLSLYGSMVILWLLLPNIERVKTPSNIWQRLW